MRPAIANPVAKPAANQAAAAVPVIPTAPVAAPSLGGPALRLGIMLSLLMLAAWYSGATAMAAPFSATAALLALLPQAPFSSPRAVLGSHVISLGAGLAAAAALLVWHGPVLVLALPAAWAAIMLMAATRTLHAPAAAHAVILALGKQDMLPYAGSALAVAMFFSLQAWWVTRNR
jgi:CBS-domain-containing membrane protein